MASTAEDGLHCAVAGGSLPGPLGGGAALMTVTDRALAFENIRLAASYFDVDMTEKSWRDLMPSSSGR